MQITNRYNVAGDNLCVEYNGASVKLLLRSLAELPTAVRAPAVQPNDPSWALINLSLRLLFGGK